jgi:hypothetical protein
MAGTTDRHRPSKEGLLKLPAVDRIPSAPAGEPDMFADPHTYSGDRNGDRHPTRQPYPDGAASRDRGAKQVGCPTIPKPDTTAETDPAGPPIHPAEGGLVTTARHRVGPRGAFGQPRRPSE